MKSILIFALFSLTIQAAYGFDIFAYQQGFVDQLGLNEEQILNANQCLSSLTEASTAIKSLLNTEPQSPELLIFRVFGLYNQYKSQLTGDCELYLTDLGGLAQKQARGLPVQTLIEDNYNRYAPYVVQQVTKWIETLSIGNEDYKAGQIQAYIFQILLGIEQPEEFPHPTVDETKFTPFEPKIFIEQFNKAFYKTKDIKDQKIIDLQTQCGVKIYNSTLDLILLSLNSTQWSDLEKQLDGSKILYNGFIETLQPCITAFKALEPLVAPFKKTFKVAPQVFIAELAYQIGMKQPEIALAKEIFSKNVYEGEYRKAGKLAGELFESITQNLRW